MSDATLTVFAGPSAYGLPGELRLPQVRWLPPAARGDVDKLVDRVQGGVLILCDGVFDVAAAVSHSELCHALDRGWEVWGVSSLGAIRAWEMRGEGMHGFGQVYEMFGQTSDFTDDEMGLLHFPEEPFFPVTEALVNVRVALREHGPCCGIDASVGTRLVDHLRSMWFGERSEEVIHRFLVVEEGLPAESVGKWLALMRATRVKHRDLAGLLAMRPWEPRA